MSGRISVPGRRIDQPQPCHLTVRLKRGAPELPARIVRLCHCTIGGSEPHEWTERCDRHPPLFAEVRGQPVDLAWLWQSGRFCTAERWRLLTEQHAWDARYAPDAPSQRPAEAIDHRELRLF